MMKRIVTVLLLAALLLSLAGCGGEKYDLLYETTVENRVYSVRGTDHLPRQLTVKENGSLLFAEKLEVDKQVGSLGGHYGLEVADLNFDGYLDMMLPTKSTGECLAYTCFLWEPSTGGYRLSEALTGLCNIRVDAEGKYLLTFSQSYEVQQEFEGDEIRSLSDTATQYVWESGRLIAHTVAKLTHYESVDIDYYCYELSYFDPTTGTLGEPHDKILTPEEYKNADFSFLYYFR